VSSMGGKVERLQTVADEDNVSQVNIPVPSGQGEICVVTGVTDGGDLRWAAVTWPAVRRRGDEGGLASCNSTDGRPRGARMWARLRLLLSISSTGPRRHAPPTPTSMPV
jgi:hypothetical protein